jgi:multidrug efflux pump subunit AcrA (membrane-fusion protein)
MQDRAAGTKQQSTPSELQTTAWGLNSGLTQAESKGSACLAICLLLAILPLAGCGPKAPVAADQPVPVRLRAPNHVQQPDSVAVSGSVEANVTALCAFQIAGRVATVPVEEGQAVSKGQVLAELDQTDYRNAYDAAQAQADAAQAVDRKAKQGPRTQEL